MKRGKKILTVMMLAVFMLAANAVLIPATTGAEEVLSLADVIKNGLKAGKSLQKVIDEALKNGNSIDKIVTEAIKAGAKADDVVYVAMKAMPFDSAHRKIVKAAFLTGAKIETIAGAAKAAGALNVIIRSGYDDALLANGMKAGEAKEKVQALDLSKNILAYSPPADNTSTSTKKSTTTFTYTVNTTGGSTPSTKTASPI